MVPVTDYATTADGLHIAYQIVGTGPTDLVFAPGAASNVDAAWDWPLMSAFLRRLATFSRLIIFDRRGTGLSDRIMTSPSQSTLEARMDDIRAVMDAAGSGRATLFTTEEGLALGVLFAATYPHRTAALISSNGVACQRWQPDYPWAVPDSEWEQDLDDVRRGWG
ncbi:MAG TPA: alpha/beta hydrolase, partial [Acidimicrobiia bacterium]|nr:alpha/beta hydrolase [Acidimicrobiia bacterium]